VQQTQVSNLAAGELFPRNQLPWSFLSEHAQVHPSSAAGSPSVALPESGAIDLSNPFAQPRARLAQNRPARRTQRPTDRKRGRPADGLVPEFRLAVVGENNGEQNEAIKPAHPRISKTQKAGSPNSSRSHADRIWPTNPTTALRLGMQNPRFTLKKARLLRTPGKHSPVSS
jgi:hypothetical protein